MATLRFLHLAPYSSFVHSGRLDGRRFTESNKKEQRIWRGYTSDHRSLFCFVYSSKHTIICSREVVTTPSRTSLQAVAETSVHTSIAEDTTKRQGHGVVVGQPLTKEAKSQLKWERMMKEIVISGSAVAVLKAHRATGKLSKQTIVGTLVRLKQLKLWAPVVEILEWLIKETSWWQFNLEDYNLLIASYGKQGEPDKAESLLEKMNGAGLEPTVATYTSLIEGFARKGLYAQAESLLKRLQESGPLPTKATYQTIISMFCRGGQYEAAEKIFKSITEGEGLKPDARMYNYMIHMYGKAGKAAEAQALIRQMKGLGLPMSAVTFNSLMSFQKTVPGAEATLRQMQLANIKPDVVTYTALINAYSKSRRVEEAQGVFQEMVASGLRPTRMTYNTLLDAYAKAKEVQGAETVLKKMTKDRCRPDIHSYTTLMAAYVNVGDMKKAEGLMEKMRRAGVEPNVVTYGTLMLGYTIAKDSEAVLHTFEALRKANIQPNQTIYTLLVRTFSEQSDFDTAFSWFKEMIGSGCEADERSRSALMDACQNNEQRDKVLELFGSIP
ncbi:hypothetical protein CY35_04G067300 [Sphagnum magellanicum]|nr:hypothetical protein CY35_04G067300 [Sphagnum magellanicum]